MEGLFNAKTSSEVEQLVKNGHDGNHCIYISDALWSPLGWACKNGNLEAVKSLLKYNAKWCIKEINFFERPVTPLGVAAIEGHLDIIDYMIETILPLDEVWVRDTQVDLIIYCIRNNRHDIFDFLVKKGILKKDSEIFGESLLHTAVKYGHVDIITKLLYMGVSVHDRDSEGRTPLLNVAISGKTNCVDHLLCYGADYNDKDYKGQNFLTLYMGKRSENYGDIVKKFVDLGCDLNCKNKYGETILFEACERIHNNHQLVKYLIDNGADDTIVNCDGKTCWDVVNIYTGCSNQKMVKNLNIEYRTSGGRMPEWLSVEYVPRGPTGCRTVRRIYN